MKQFFQKTILLFIGLAAFVSCTLEYDSRCIYVVDEIQAYGQKWAKYTIVNKGPSVGYLDIAFTAPIGKYSIGDTVTVIN